MRSISELYVDSIDTMPVNIDWYEIPFEAYTTYIWQKCTLCGQEGLIAGHYCENCRGFNENAGEPALGYYYPIFAIDNMEKATQAISHLPLSIIWMGRQVGYVLVPTEVGVDLSWKIAEGFMRLGYLPPLCLLPLVNKEPDETSAWVVEGFLHGVQTRRRWLKLRMDELRYFLECFPNTKN